ncbi:MAG: ligase-associated DNA damage response endonuclease PdeM [Pseudomonadota bacterium]
MRGISTTNACPDGALAVDVAGVACWFLAQRAAFLPAMSTLLLADWHLGKTPVFGRFGLPIPAGDEAHDFARLAQIVASVPVRRILVLGDLMHAAPSAADSWPQDLSDWLQAHSHLQMTVVAGNHDRIDPARLPAGLSKHLTWHAGALDEGNLRFEHEPDRVPGRFVIAGHLHPTRRLVVGADRIRAPAFWLQRDRLVLPSFGSFTGGHNIRPLRGDRVFVTDGDDVIDVSIATT